MINFLRQITVCNRYSSQQFGINDHVRFPMNTLNSVPISIIDQTVLLDSYKEWTSVRCYRAMQLMKWLIDWTWWLIVWTLLRIVWTLWLIVWIAPQIVSHGMQISTTWQICCSRCKVTHRSICLLTKALITLTASPLFKGNTHVVNIRMMCGNCITYVAIMSIIR